ncbi:S-layer homology domain-containing protein [Sedimentibacter sp. B4]|uniref:S-layer homology domain-containing protein n=1 Tax=Sedimentibacter sp. B4 TaxID=304766 RepID=UPI0002F9317F|nr:S-layer homology domain-containing protein [Sedimentibacter sp. B4]
MTRKINVKSTVNKLYLKKIVAIVLSILMSVTALPFNSTLAFAADSTNGAGEKSIVIDYSNIITYAQTVTGSSITYNGTEDTKVAFYSSDFVSECQKTVAGTFKSIKIPSLPNSSYGKLYIGYVSSSSYSSTVTAGTEYDATNIGKMSFVPYSGFYGTVDIPFYGYNTNGDIFEGTIKIVIAERKVDADTIKYTTYEEMPADFKADDFDDECVDTTGDNINYVKFTLPSSSSGRLYVGYVSSNSYGSKVAEGTKYYENDLDNITFVPYQDYHGKVIISYIGYSDDGESYTGEVEITVNQYDWDADPILYSTGSFTPLSFDSDDFADACDDANNEGLDYVKFTLPSSTYGILYYDYTSSTKYDSKVSASTKYYENDLDDVVFVPKSNYKGTFIISYTGYDDDGDSFTGVVKITVKEESTVADTINVSTKEDTVLYFDDDDFNDVCEDATNEELDYIKFTLPSSSYGRLYYNYSSPSSYGSLVSEGTKYYYDDSPSLSKVAFVPYKDYNGTVTVKYTGWNTDGVNFTGTVKITVTAVADSAASSYFNDVTSSYSWASASIDYLFEKGVVTGTGGNNYSPAQNMIRGDFMLMLYRALDLSASSKSNFSDVPAGSYYYTAIATAKALGIAKGYDDLFMPNAPITREDAMVLVARALKADGKTLTTGSISDLNNFKDKGSVSDYAVSSVATLVKAGIVTGSNSYLNPKSYVTRAEMAVILYRVLK